MSSKHGFMHILRTLLISGLAYVVNYGITLVLTPYITDVLGTDAYGFVTLAKQFAQYAVIITTALNIYASRFISIAYHKEDYDKANVYFSSVFFGDVMLSSAILLVAVWFILLLDRLIFIPAGLVIDVKLLFLFLFINLWVSTVCSVFGCAAHIKNRMDLTGLFKTLSYLTDAVVLVAAYVLFPARILYVAFGTLAATLVVAAADFCITRKYTPKLRLSTGAFSFAAVKKLVFEGCWASISMVGDLLNNGLDLIICNQMLTSLAMGQLAIAKTMHSIMQSLYSIVNQAFIPMFLKSYAHNDMKKLLRELKLSMKVSGLLANITFAGFVALGTAYYHLWIPHEDIDLIYKLTIVTILTCVPTGALHPLYYVYTLTVKRKIPCLFTIAGGICNVIGMYVLIRYAGMGVYAVAWTTVAVMCVISFIANPLYMAHVLHLPKRTFYPDILRNVLASLALTMLFKGLTLLYMPSSWLTLCVCAAVYACLGMPVHLLIVCGREDRKELLAIFRQRMKKSPATSA